MQVKKRSTLVLFFLILVELAHSQSKDTLRVMTYNLMYYREFTSFCTSSNNNPNSKDANMQTIIDYALPDILVVNELGGSNATLNSFRLFTNAMNASGRTNYDLASANSNSNLANMLYFNSNKLDIKNQTTITQDLSGGSLIRLIDVYTLYHLEPNLAQHNDTTFLHVFAAHLKAGSSSSDQAERADATEAIMDYVDVNNLDGNVLIMGDFNLYRSNEAAYQDLVNYTNPTYRFNDPVGISGNWGNSVYAFLHTQSTHTSGGCFASGGMDDRFDFILASNKVMNNTDRIGYINNSYETLGQDGNRYNGSLISPANNSAPTAVINALYNMSDHLPVMMDLEVTGPASTALINNEQSLEVSFQNPNPGRLVMRFGDKGQALSSIQLLNLSGSVLRDWQLNRENLFERNITNLPKGIYFLRFELENNQQFVKKLIKI
ncbi:MAG: T9SS type A sorting domain-containing protein [Vicingaceae bacterium]